MKKVIRKGTFETNSSSTHSLTMCMKDEYEKWCRGEVLLVEDTWGFTCEIKEKFISKEKAIDLLKHNYKYLPKNMDWNDEDNVNERLSRVGFKRAGDYDEYCEEYYGEFTTPNGDVVVAFGEYGHDG